MANIFIRARSEGIVALLLCLTALRPVSGQGTIRFGFEEYEIGSTPPFVQPNTINGIRYFGAVADSPILPYEGAKYLSVLGSVLIGSPNSEPIQAFGLRLFMPSFPGLSFGAGNTPGRVEETGTWQLLTGVFASPVAQFAISGFYRDAGFGETFPAVFGVDDVQLTTIPEPSTAALGLIGGAFLFAMWSWPVASRKGQAIRSM